MIYEFNLCVTISIHEKLTLGMFWASVIMVLTILSSWKKIWKCFVPVWWDYFLFARRSRRATSIRIPWSRRSASVWILRSWRSASIWIPGSRRSWIPRSWTHSIWSPTWKIERFCELSQTLVEVYEGSFWIIRVINCYLIGKITEESRE